MNPIRFPARPTWVNFPPLIRLQAGLFSICRLIRRPHPSVSFSISSKYNAAKTLNVTVNGHAHPTAWPYPDTQGYTWRTLAVTTPITDLVPGTNVVQLGSDQGMVTSNVNIVLVDVPGGVPVLPGSNNAYPAGGSP